MNRIETLQQMLASAVKVREEIDQIFIDADHWNTSVRKPEEEPIDPDPDGKMRKMAAGLDLAIPNLKSEISNLKS